MPASPCLYVPGHTSDEARQDELCRMKLRSMGRELRRKITVNEDGCLIQIRVELKMIARGFALFQQAPSQGATTTAGVLGTLTIRAIWNGE